MIINTTTNNYVLIISYIKKIIYIFILLFSYFYLSYSYYQPSKLIVKLNHQTSEEVRVNFDSGNGFTAYNIINPTKKIDKLYEFQLPQIKIRSLKINLLDKNLIVEDAYLLLENNEEIKINLNSNFESTKKISDLIKKTNFKLIVIQALLSIIIGILIINLHNLFIQYKQYISRFDIKIFLYIFIPIFIIYLLWFVSSFPGLMTNDSFASLSESKTMIFTDWQPYIYTIYLLFLLNIYDSIATVSLIQVIIYSITISLIFYYIYKNLNQKIFFYPFYFLALFSIPIGIYNNIIWKDIPFSYIVFIISILIYFGYLYYKKHGKLNLNNNFIFIISLIYIGLLHLRHNGIILAIFIIPFCYKILNLKSFYKLLIAFVSSIILVFLLLPNILNVKMTKGAPLFQFVTVVQIMTHPNYFSLNQNKDISIIEEASGLKWGFIKNNYPHNFFEIWDSTKFVREGTQFTDGGGNTNEYNKIFLFRLILDNLPIYISSKSYEFLHSIGLDQSRSDATNNFFQDPLQLYGSHLRPPGNYQWGVSIDVPVLSQRLRSIFDRIGVQSTNYRGFISTQLFTWSLLPPFFLFFYFLWTKKYNEPICIYLYPSILIAFSVFIVGSGQSWRYFYYVYLCSLFLVPLYLAENNDIK